MFKYHLFLLQMPVGQPCCLLFLLGFDHRLLWCFHIGCCGIFILFAVIVCMVLCVCAVRQQGRGEGTPQLTEKQPITPKRLNWLVGQWEELLQKGMGTEHKEDSTGTHARVQRSDDQNSAAPISDSGGTTTARPLNVKVITWISPTQLLVTVRIKSSQLFSLSRQVRPTHCKRWSKGRKERYCLEPTAFLDRSGHMPK